MCNNNVPQLQQYKSSTGQDGDKPKENGTVPGSSPEQNGEQQQTKVTHTRTTLRHYTHKTLSVYVAFSALIMLKPVDTG
jgi:hypothetical protein